MKLRGLAMLGLLLAVTSALAGDWRQDRRTVHDSLRDVEPWRLRSWLAEHGLQDYYRSNSYRPESTGLRCVGRWSYGPSLKVSLRVTADDTIVCLARGSGASIIRFRSRDSLSLDLLSDVDCYGIVSRAIIQDTLVFCGMRQGGTGIEVWGVSDLTSPHRLSYVYLPPIMDIAVQDTFLYATGYTQDSLRIFNVRDPRNPTPVGACSDSGFPMCVSGNYCYLADRGGINIIDVSDPTTPHRVGRAGAGGIALSVAVRDSLCFFGLDDNSMRVFNVANPASPFQVGSLTGIQPSDIYLPPTCDTVLYTPRLDIINITNPASPRIIGQVGCPGWDYGVTAAPALNYALVADCFDGLVAVDVTNPAAPAVDTSVFSAGSSEDIYVDQNRAYVAQYFSGLRILDIANPAFPVLLGLADTFGVRPATHTVCASDSFAFVGWTPVPYFRPFEVSDPARPLQTGGCDVTNFPEDMVLRDSFVYVAEDYALQVVNVARPRQPVLVGSCVLPGYSGGMDLEDSVAYVASAGLQCVKVSNPAAPVIVGSWSGMPIAVEVVDTIAYAGGMYCFVTLDVSNPAAPHMLDSIWLVDVLYGVAVEDTLAFAGGNNLHIFSVADPANIHEVASWRPPYGVSRLCYSAPYLYATCYDAGVCILETVMTGLAEEHSLLKSEAGVRAWPTVTQGALWVECRGRLTGQPRCYDVSGAAVCASLQATSCGDGLWLLDLSQLPNGVYGVGGTLDGRILIQKIVKPERR